MIIDPAANINILPDVCLNVQDCKSYATIYNKVGGYFQIFVPVGNLVVSNIIFDSIDSVLDRMNWSRVYITI